MVCKGALSGNRDGGLEGWVFLIEGEEALGGEAEGVCDAVEGGEEGDEVDGFGDLGFGPAGEGEGFDIGAVDGLRILIDLVGEGEKGALGGSDGGGSQVSVAKRIDEPEGAALHAQEAGVAVSAVGALIAERDEGGEHLLVAAREMTVGEEKALREGHHVAEQGRMGGEALEDAGDGGATEVLAEVLIEGGDFRGCLMFLDDGEIGRARWGSGPAKAG